MNHNVGKVDRTIRVVAGIAIIAWGINAQSWLGLIGIVPLLTAFMRWCPAYLPFGLTTCGKG